MMTTYQDEAFAERVQQALLELLVAAAENGDLPDDLRRLNVWQCRSYEDAGLLTMDKGLQLQFSDGAEARLTIQAATPAGWGEEEAAYREAEETSPVVPTIPFHDHPDGSRHAGTDCDGCR